MGTRRTCFLVVAILLGFSCSDVRGQTVDDALINSIVGTKYFELIEHSSQGKLVGCGFEFRTVVRDYANDLGKPVLLNGSVTSFYFKGKVLNFTLKVRANSVLFSQRLEPVFSPFHISYAYLKSKAYSSAGRETTKFDCEGGGFCASYTDFQEILVALADNQLSVAYTRTPSGMDVITQVDFSQAENGLDNMAKGLQCFSRLLDRFGTQD